MAGTNRLSIYAGSALMVLAAFAVGYIVGGNAARNPTIPAVPGIVWPPPPVLEPFELVDADGGRFDEKRLRGKWTLLFFGYTHCPDICPTTLATLKRIDEALRDSREYQARGQVVFISVDGERDTSEQLKTYTGYFNPDFIAASAPTERLHKLTRQFGIRIVRVSTDDPNEYWFDHPASILLIGPDTRVVGEFVPPLVGEDIASQIRQILDWGRTSISP